MLTQNNVPVLALIIEPLLAIFMTYVVIRTLQKYMSRKRVSTSLLAFSFVFYALALWSTSIGKYIQFFSQKSVEESVMSEFTILIAYCFVLAANCFIFAFVNNVFLGNKQNMLILISLLNGIVIGFIAPNVSDKPGTYSSVLPAVVALVLLTMIVSGIMIYFSLKEAKNNDDKLPKLGFILIAFYGIFLILVFVLFAVDIAWGTIADTAYTPAYYAAWICSGLAVFSAYLGYVMPNWFRTLIRL